MRASGFVARRQHDDRHRGGGADEAGEIEAGFAGHHDVEDQQIEMQAEQLGAGVAGAHRGGDAIAFAGEKARQQIADAAVVVDQQQMRGVVGRLRRRSRDGCSRWLRHGHSLALLAAGAEDRLQHLVGIVAIDHRAQELRAPSPRRPDRCSPSARLMRSVCRPASFATSASPFGGGVKQALPAVVVAGLLHDIALVEQLLEHPAQRLLGDAQHVEQIGDLQAGIAVDEMHHPVMGPAEPERLQLMVGIADEIAIGEEQQLDDIPAQIAGAGPERRRPRPRIGVGGRALRNLCQPY